MTIHPALSTDISNTIWGRQYSAKGTDEPVLSGFHRVATSVSRTPEAAAAIYQLMAAGKFVPGGRILAGVGTQHRNTLNCFVVGANSGVFRTTADVFDMALKNALITKVGGGTGENLDTFPSRRDAQPTLRTRPVYVYLDPQHPDFQLLQDWRYRDITQSKGVEWLTPPRRAVNVLTSMDDLGDVEPTVIHVHDSIRGIMSAAKLMWDILDGQIQTEQYGAQDTNDGSPIVLDLTSLRPDGEEIKGSGGTASGPSSFAIEIFDNFLYWHDLGGVSAGPVAYLRYVGAPTKRVIRQGGTRRGAGMATITLDHPDWEDFMTSKEPSREASEGDISTYNISLLVGHRHTDVLVGRQVWMPDWEKWQKIARYAHSTGEPGLLLEDAINDDNVLLGVDGPIKSSNPCGEIPLYPGEPCDLGAINVAEYVLPAQPDLKADLDWKTLRRDMDVALEFLDANLDYSSHAVEQTQRMSLRNRRLGLGLMGLADAMVALDMPYGSQESLEFAERLGHFMSVAALEWTEAAALRLGEPEWSVLAREAGVLNRPRRNVAVLTVAPTGTTSMLLGVSGGIEPTFSPFIWRKVGSEYVKILHPALVDAMNRDPQAIPTAYLDWIGEIIPERVMAALSSEHGTLQGVTWLPEKIRRVFVYAHDVTPAQHVQMQGAVQTGMAAVWGISNSISKTVNLPHEATVDDVLTSFMQAVTSGCKGTTVYRDGSRSFQVLSTTDKAENDAEGSEALAAELNAACAGGSCEKPVL